VKYLATVAALPCLALACGVAHGEVYAYVNDNGDYVVTQDHPGRTVGEYAVLTDDGRFLRLIRPPDMDVPISHWRPWFLPKEADPYDADPDLYREREGVVDIEEVDAERDRQEDGEQ
jgi:hypothetical protein